MAWRIFDAAGNFIGDAVPIPDGGGLGGCLLLLLGGPLVIWAVASQAWSQAHPPEPIVSMRPVSAQVGEAVRVWEPSQQSNAVDKRKTDLLITVEELIDTPRITRNGVVLNKRIKWGSEKTLRYVCMRVKVENLSPRVKEIGRQDFDFGDAAFNEPLNDPAVSCDGEPVRGDGWWKLAPGETVVFVNVLPMPSDQELKTGRVRHVGMLSSEATATWTTK